MLRDRLVLGCRSHAARKRLLTIANLTLQAARDEIAIFEAVESTPRDVLNHSLSPHEVDHVAR